MVQTDHRALESLLKSTALNPELTRWALYLQQIQHDNNVQAGNYNENADGLSRQVWHDFEENMDNFEDRKWNDQEDNSLKKGDVREGSLTAADSRQER